MPGGNRTGPMGAGPMTGRGAGFCAGSGRPGTMGGRGAMGFGAGGGRGCDWRNRFFASGLPAWPRWWGSGTAEASAMSVDQEKQMLEQQLKPLQDALDSMKQRLSDLEKPEK